MPKYFSCYCILECFCDLGSFVLSQFVFCPLENVCFSIFPKIITTESYNFLRVLNIYFLSIRYKRLQQTNFLSSVRIRVSDAIYQKCLEVEIFCANVKKKKEKVNANFA